MRLKTSDSPQINYYWISDENNGDKIFDKRFIRQNNFAASNKII